MNIADEHEELREYRNAVRAFLAAEPGPAPWKRFAVELGAAGLLIPEEYGGAGSSISVALQVLAETAASTTGLPYLTGAVLAPYALVACPDSAPKSEYLEAIAGGELLATIAMGETGCGATAHSDVRAACENGHWILDGVVEVVLEADSADVLLVVAETAGGSTGLFAVSSSDSGLTVQSLTTLDLTRPASRVEFSATPAQVLSGEFSAGRRELFDLACVALAVEMAGAATAAMEMAVDYAGIRSQFGSLIGSQQLVQKLCADMFVVVASVRSISTAATRALDAGDEDAHRLAGIAKAYASEKTPTVGEANIQVHGGIGFTWEHPAHHFLRRLRADAQLFGDARFHRRRLAVELELASV